LQRRFPAGYLTGDFPLPSITRDVALLVDKKVDADQMLGFINVSSEELLEKVCIFDVYEGKGIPMACEA